ncbi:MAG: tetratricopeptide repeat protein [Candidatus Eisenbacteria sp.]|nr:tetratricopeptide repeat protein [Candidatus Eisenbacteria bacterium]
MPECPFCNESAESEDRFCGKCGAELTICCSTERHRETVPVMSVAQVRRRLGAVYYRRGNRRGAMEVWAKSLELEPDNEEARALMIQVELELDAES